MSQHSREDGVAVDDDEGERCQRFSTAGYPPLLLRPDDETAEEPGWISLTCRETADDNRDDRPLSELPEAAIEQRLANLEDR